MFTNGADTMLYSNQRNKSIHVLSVARYDCQTWNSTTMTKILLLLCLSVTNLIAPLSHQSRLAPRVYRLSIKIARHEGFYKHGSLPYRLHNPGALRFHHQFGAIR